jgi:hypothetical protein
MDRCISNHERHALDPWKVFSGGRHMKLITLITVMTLMTLMPIDDSEERQCSLSRGRR